MKIALLALALSSSLVFAQAPAGKLEDKKAATYNEIERGLFFEARGGFTGVINPPAAAGTRSYFSPGQSLGVDLGFDIGERVSPSIFFLASSNRMGSDYTGLNATNTASGDFSSMIPGAAVRVRLVGFADSQEVKRTWISLRGGAGVVFYSPQALLPTLDVLVTAGPSLEYYTKLRHFVIGVEANFNFMALTQSVGFSTLLTFKYAFPFQ